LIFHLANTSKRFLFFFLDGVGLGEDDPEINPFSRARLPTLEALLGGEKFTLSALPLKNSKATLVAIDANLGVPGLPQSATGQAVLLTGKNIPVELGYHYGPKPNPPIAGFLQQETLFHTLHAKGLKTAYLNAFPPRYFQGIQSGRRLYSAIPLAAHNAGIGLNNVDDLVNGKALSADFTGQGWRDHLGFEDTPLLTPYQAGERLSTLASNGHFSLFEYWLTDYAGHHQDMRHACQILSMFDEVLAGLLAAWDTEDSLILVTSDHGNLEDLSTRRHTPNPAPALLIGKPEVREAFTEALFSTADIAPAVYRFFELGN
jgi:2,3-bisphosphoglycerate-independent phosphoglycerate mutase